MRSTDNQGNINLPSGRKDAALADALKRADGVPVLIHKGPTFGLGQHGDKQDRLMACTPEYR